jgi:hypothetical protein
MFNPSSKQILVGIFAALLLLTMPAHAVKNFKVSNYGGANQIWFEAEDFDERDPATDQYYTVVDEAGAFGQAINRDNGPGMIRWTFDISKAGGTGGTWYFWGRVINPGNQSDFLLVEGDPDDAEIPTGPPWPGGDGTPPFVTSDDRVFEENTGPPWAWGLSNHEEGHTKELQNGENTMYIFDRSGNNTVFWDVFMWTDDPDYVPTDADYENATVPTLGGASNPSPSGGATDVPRDAVLSWAPGEYAPAVNGHTLYFGENFNEVNDGIGAIIQSAASYAPPQRLDFETTYYWRVDEVNAPPDSTVHQGKVWSFTTEPVSYPIANVTATASSSAPNQGPENAVNGSGLSDDLHSRETEAMWLSSPSGPQPTWIQFEFDKVYILHEMWVWNSNTDLETSIGFGARDVSIEYSVDGIDYMILGTAHEFNRAPGEPDYAHNTTFDLGGLIAKYVRFTVNSNWGGWLPQYGLSEVRFLNIPVSAREPSPDSGATDVDVDVTLGWRAGRQATTHDVYMSADEQAVIDGTAPVTAVTEASHGPLSLDMGSTYYWRVDEVNDTETPTTWQGDIGSFLTQEFLVVDDFESYNDIEAGQEGSNLIYLTWVDGFDNPSANGSTIGYTQAFQPTMESGIVHGGKQSVPLLYDNSVASLSEVTVNTADLAIGRDWTKGGAKTLGFWFHGAAGNTGQLYVKVNGVKVLYDGDAGNLAAVAWQPWNIDLTTLGVNLQSVTTLTIGIDGNGTGGSLYFDDIRLYAYARQFVTPTAPDPAGLLAQYELEGNANDSAGTAHGTPTGGLFVAGRFGQAISLAGNDYVDCGNPGELDFGTGSWSVSAWITMPASTTNNMNIFSNGGDSAGGIRYMLGVSETDDHKACLTVDDNVTKVQSTSSATVDDGQWHHIVGIRDGGSLRIYVNGFQDGDDVGLPDGYDLSGTSQANAYIGAGWNYETSAVEKVFVGVIDEVRVYNYALSSAEVRSLSGATLPFDEPF